MSTDHQQPDQESHPAAPYAVAAASARHTVSHIDRTGQYYGYYMQIGLALFFFIMAITHRPHITTAWLAALVGPSTIRTLLLPKIDQSPPVGTRWLALSRREEEGAG